MEWDISVLSLIQTLVWPIVVICIAIVFRSPITALLNAVREASANVLGSNLNLKFEQGADQLRGASIVFRDAETPDSPDDEAEPSSPTESESAEKEQLGYQSQQGTDYIGDDPWEILERVALDHPRSAVQESWHLVEVGLGTLAAKIDVPPAQEGHRLIDQLIPRYRFRSGFAFLLNELRILSNEAAHSASDISHRSAIDYVQSAHSAVDEMRRVLRTESP